MKYTFLLFCFLLIILSASAQTRGTAKLYGYVQSVMPGANLGVINEAGEEVPEKNPARKNYRIYAVSSSRIYPVEMWINGEPYSVKMDIISTTPVVHGSETMGNRTELVPATSQKVILLSPAPYTETKNIGDVRSIASSNELVLVYRQNGKFYYSALNELTQLEAAAMQ